MSKHYAGLDVSNKKTSVCVMDLDGNIVKEGKVDSDPEAIALWLFDIPDMEYHRVGLEAGTLSQFLYAGLAKAGLPAVVIETRHAKAILKNQTNKTDKNDARGIANMMRSNMFKPVHVKTDESQKARALLACRRPYHRRDCLHHPVRVETVMSPVDEMKVAADLISREAPPIWSGARG